MSEAGGGLRTTPRERFGTHIYLPQYPASSSDQRFAGHWPGQNPLKHEPCRLLSDGRRAGDLAGTNRVGPVADQPERAHPLVESRRRVLEEGG